MRRIKKIPTITAFENFVEIPVKNVVLFFSSDVLFNCPEIAPTIEQIDQVNDT
jgi:hypothetical protein